MFAYFDYGRKCKARINQNGKAGPFNGWLYVFAEDRQGKKQNLDVSNMRVSSVVYIGLRRSLSVFHLLNARCTVKSCTAKIIVTGDGMEEVQVEEKLGAHSVSCKQQSKREQQKHTLRTAMKRQAKESVARPMKIARQELVKSIGGLSSLCFKDIEYVS